MNNNTSFKSIAEAFKKRNQKSTSPDQQHQEKHNEQVTNSTRHPINSFNKYSSFQIQTDDSNPYLKSDNNKVKQNEVSSVRQRKPTMVNVSKSQKGNPLLDLLTSKNVPWQYSEIS
ncbi:hypothetical protein QEN19_003536 [Hanseniaspora menglaensis]